MEVLPDPAPPTSATTAVCTSTPKGDPNNSDYFTVGSDGFVSDVSVHPFAAEGCESLEVYILSKNLLLSLVGGHELLAGVLASQVISNVPTALLLSGFTENVKALIVGTNLGGLGTLIASMASLISLVV